jgi:hypothetical protein
MRRFTYTCLLLLVLWITPVLGQGGYTWIPKQDHYVLRQNSKAVDIYFIPAKDFREYVKFAFGQYDDRVLAFTTIYLDQAGKPMAYKIFCPKHSDGSVDLTSLGHEISHVLDGTWHKD